MVNLSASGKVSGHRSAYSQTFNLLSQYVKEKKTIGDLSLGMFSNGDERGQNDVFRPTTMNLFPVNNKPAGESNAKSMDLFPQQACFASQSIEPQTSQLTIFYGGQVIAFNDFPAHKAKEIMDLATRGISAFNETNTNNTSSVMKTAAEKVGLAPQSLIEQTATPIVTDLPIARKASLHRFLEKRKDRIKAKAPYSTSKPGDDMPLKTNQSNPWLGLAANPRS